MRASAVCTSRLKTDDFESSENKCMKETTIEYNAAFGIGVPIALIFISMKIIGAISWPWLWVLSPIWIPFLIVFFIRISIFLKLSREVHKPNI